MTLAVGVCDGVIEGVILAVGVTEAVGVIEGDGVTEGDGGIRKSLKSST